MNQYICFLTIKRKLYIQTKTKTTTNTQTQKNYIQKQKTAKTQNIQQT